MRKSLWVIAALFATLTAPAATADAIYTYAGNAGTSCSGAYAVPGTTTCNATYMISGSFTLAGALAPGLSAFYLAGGIDGGSDIPLTGFSYTDNGAITIGDAVQGSAFSAQVWTNAFGAIVNWDIDLFNDNSALSGICRSQFCGIDSVNLAAGQGLGACLEGPGGSPICTYDESGYSDPAGFMNTNDAGTWTMTSSNPTPTPEPSSLLLAATGLVVLMGSGLIRKRLA